MNKTKKAVKKLFTATIAVFVISVCAPLAGKLENTSTKNLIDAALLTKIQSAPSTALSPVFGYSYFSRDSGLEQKIDLVRLPVSWENFVESKDSVINWQNSDAKKIESLIQRKKKIVPLIRTRSFSLTKSRLPGENPICSNTPLDLQSTFNETFGFSKSYYSFLKAFAEKYRGNFPYIVIENEMNDPKYFCGQHSADDYIKMLKTAVKALHDGDPAIKVMDGGLQGWSLGWLAINNLLVNSKTSAAINLHKSLNNLTTPLTLNEVIKATAEQLAKPNIKRAKALVDKGLFTAPDTINFHHYQTLESLAESVSYIKRASGNKPIGTNEIGRNVNKTVITNKESQVKLAAQETAKKVTTLLAEKLEPIIWYAHPGTDYYNSAAMVTGDADLHDLAEEESDNDDVLELVLENRPVAAYNLINKLLNRKPLNVKNETQHNGIDTVVQTFEFPGDTVTVAWAKQKRDTYKLIPRTNCTVYNYTGQVLTTPNSLLFNPDPIFMQCPK